MSSKPLQSPPYSFLARIYDRVMDDVNYEAWADFIDEVIQTQNPDAEKLLEIACGTGSISLSLDQLDCYDITACDRSPQMIEEAKSKSKDLLHGVVFNVADFLELPANPSFDVVFCAFDSVNYILDRSDFSRLFSSVKGCLKEDGIFIFDFTTPSHSRSAIEYLHNEEGTLDKEDGTKIHFQRCSIFDEKSRLHRNEFLIRIENEDAGTEPVILNENHVQRIYSFSEMKDVLSSNQVALIDAYEDFELHPATDSSARITMVCKWP